MSRVFSHLLGPFLMWKRDTKATDSQYMALAPTNTFAFTISGTIYPCQISMFRCHLEDVGDLNSCRSNHQEEFPEIVNIKNITKVPGKHPEVSQVGSYGTVFYSDVRTCTEGTGASFDVQPLEVSWFFLNNSLHIPGSF